MTGLLQNHDDSTIRFGKRMTQAITLAQPTPIFVYGTLRKGQGLHRVLDGSIDLDMDVVKGCLFDLGHYPGFIHGDGDVVGEVYEVSPATLLRLDQIEQGYKRERVPTRGGGLVWIYVWQGATAYMKPIPSGDWLRREQPIARNLSLVKK